MHTHHLRKHVRVPTDLQLHITQYVHPLSADETQQKPNTLYCGHLYTNKPVCEYMDRHMNKHMNRFKSLYIDTYTSSVVQVDQANYIYIQYNTYIYIYVCRNYQASGLASDRHAPSSHAGRSPISIGRQLVRQPPPLHKLIQGPYRAPFKGFLEGVYTGSRVWLYNVGALINKKRFWGPLY